MLIVISLIVWIALTAALHGYLNSTNRPAEPIMASLLAAGLGISGAFQIVQWHDSPSSEVFHDTYYIITSGTYLLQIAISYLGAALIALLVRKLARGWTQTLLPFAFWAFHLGAGAVVLTTVLVDFQAPKRYVDYPDAFYWFNLISNFGGLLGFVGMASLLTLTGIALLQAALKRRAS